MKEMTDRRRWDRKPANQTLIGIMQGRGVSPQAPPGSEGHFPTVFLDVVDLSECGALVQSPHDLNPSGLLEFVVYDLPNHTWESQYARPVRTQQSPAQDHYLIGLEFLPDPEGHRSAPSLADGCLMPQPADLDFLMNTNVFDSIPRAALCQLLNCLTPKSLLTGERLFSQGDAADSLYIIQEGRCSVKVEKDGEIHHVACLREGDVVGEIAVLTGGLRSAHVDADTEVKLWGLSKNQFAEVSANHPDLRYFLTELVTKRFEAETFTDNRTVGKYVITSKLGKGGWSIVYRGAHKILNLPVAIKMLKHNMAMETSFLEKFRNEAKIIAQLNHKNIVHVYDIEELYQTLFIVMEYLQGESLESLLERMGRIPIARVVDFLVQTCHGLGYAHENNIVHQDIKPANIFVQPRDQIKILDFGLACAPGCEDLNMAGTIYYAAPEQILGHPVDVRTDIYSLGITAYEMIVGARPYPEEDLNALVDMRLEQDLPDPSLLVPDVPAALLQFVSKACRRKPSQRYPSISAALDDLDPLHHELCRDSGRREFPGRKMMSLLFLYQEDHQLAFNRMLDEFTIKVQELGVVMKAASFEDLGK